MIDIDDLPGEAADIEKSDVQPPESEKHPDIEEQIRRMLKASYFTIGLPFPGGILSLRKNERGKKHRQGQETKNTHSPWESNPWK